MLRPISMQDRLLPGLVRRPYGPKRSTPLYRTGARLLPLLLGHLLLLHLVSGYPIAQAENIPDVLKKQLHLILADKARRSPAQRRISSHLLWALKQRQSHLLISALPKMKSTIKIAPDDTTLVNIKTSKPAQPALLDTIAALGGTVIQNFPSFHLVQAKLSLSALEILAKRSDVTVIQPAAERIIHQLNPSEGELAHQVDLARATFGVTGVGVKVCVLSNGIDALTALQASGDLPRVRVLPRQHGSGSEGTAMLEIVHDLAPGAELLFATAGTSEAQFAINILALRGSGCQVIVDDVLFTTEPVFQDGIIAQAVDTVVENGAVYFASAGNAGNLNDGTSGVWEGDYISSGVTVRIGGGLGGLLHDFDGNEAITNGIVADAPFAVTLHWADALGTAHNDYDLCVVNDTLTDVIACATDLQNGTANPIEWVGPQTAGDRIMIINFNGRAATRYLHLNTLRGRLEYATSGQLNGHSGAASALSIAAVDAATASEDNFTFTGGAANPVQSYSSDGPRRVFFEADGTPITPGNFTATGGMVRQKPNLAAADGVSTATPGHETFFGTSASAPHAAAIAALALSMNPELLPSEVSDLLAQTALDIEAPGIDRDSGAGILNAFAVLDTLSRNVPITPQPPEPPVPPEPTPLLSRHIRHDHWHRQRRQYRRYRRQ